MPFAFCLLPVAARARAATGLVARRSGFSHRQENSSSSACACSSASGAACARWGVNPLACCCAPLLAFGVFAPLRHGAMAPLSARALASSRRAVLRQRSLYVVVCARSAYQLRRWWSLCAASASSARAPTGSLQRRRAPSRECSAFEKTRGRNSRARSGVWRSRRKLTVSASLFKLRCAARRCWAMAAFAQQCVLR